jgi:polynucleotide 5'-hydroxyl-kinase GRC3/NOL9
VSDNLPEVVLKRGNVIKIEGFASLHVKEGRVSIIGGVHEKLTKVVVPRAKSIPVEAESDAVVEYILGPGGKMERLPGRTIPREWDMLVEEIIAKKPRVILVLGEADTGKSFFSTYIANMLVRKNLRVAVVDGDAGQSDVGPPTTLGVVVVEKPVVFLHDIPSYSAYFIGSMSPAGHIFEFMVGIKRMVERGLENADIAVVNTAGWTSGGPGRALRLYEMELLKPDIIVALQRGKELEHILKCTDQSKVRRIQVSKHVRHRSRSDRTFLRELALARYFDGAGRLILDLRKVLLERCYFRTGEPIDPKSLGDPSIIHAEKMPEGLFLVVSGDLSDSKANELKAKFKNLHVISPWSAKNVVVGLANSNNELIGLGIIDEIDYVHEKLAVITPVKDASRIAVVQFGSMKITPDGKEIGTIKPGTF